MLMIRKKITELSSKILSLIQILLILGIYAVEYYSKRRMGFMRYLVYLNKKMESSFFNESFRTLLLIFIVLILIYYSYKLYKTKKTSYLAIYFSIIEIFAIRGTFFSGLLNNIIVLGFGIIILLELVKEIELKKMESRL